MSKLLFTAVAVAALVTATAQPALAAAQADVTPSTTQIGGNVQVKATMNGAQSNVAVGNNNTQRNSVCTTYEGTQVGGNLTMTCTVNGAQSNVAVGNNNKQTNDVGGMGAGK